MNRYEFDNLISDYLDGSISFNKQKEFEQYMEQDLDAAHLVENIRNTISKMNQTKQVKVSDNFNDKLLLRLKTERRASGPEKNTLFGFTPFYASMFSFLCVALFFVTSQVFKFSENFDFDNNSNQYTTSLKDNPTVNNEYNFQGNKNYAVDSDVDSLKNEEDRKKPSNSNKIKFVNY